jgi:PncC family amidohydrolase
LTAHGNSGYILTEPSYQPDHRQFFHSRKEFYKAIIKTLSRLNITFSVAESITGGLVSSSITSVPRSSKVFKGGVVAYSLSTKEVVLGLSSEFLERNSDVSEETARKLAEQSRKRMLTTIGGGTCGYAGEHPPRRAKGEFYVALNWGSGETVRYNRERLEWQRRTIQRVAADSLLWNLYKWGREKHAGVFGF